MKKIYFIFLITLIIYGCAAPQIAPVSETMSMKEVPQVEAPKPEEVPKPLKEETEVPKGEGLFSLSVRDVDIRDVFLLLSKDSGVNIIADADVTGKISVDFTGLNLESALYAITRPLGYTFRMDKGFIRVNKPILETWSFSLNYITGRRASTSTMQAAITGGGTTGTPIGTTSNINLNLTTTGTTQATQATTTAGGQGNVNVTTSGVSDFWNEARKGLEVIIFGDATGGDLSEGGFSRGDKSGKKLVINEMAGVIHVTDYSDNMERVADFLNDVEKAVRRQVMIQAHIVEVSLDDSYSFGIDWELLTGSGMGERGSLFRFSQELVPTPETGVFQIGITDWRINALLDAMKKQGQVNVLSSPKISTMNNQRAVIKLTTKEVSWITNTILNAEGNVVLSYTTPQIDEVGIFLDVTPQIDESGTITMQIHPSISEKTKESKSPDGKSSRPIIDVREVDTMIKVRNGQTIVIAGLITDKVNETITRVPFLGDLPLLGNLFKQTVQEKRKSELVLLMTPYVLSDLTIEEIRKEHEKRLGSIGRSFELVPAIK
jgi:MSHA biogenesis protein MshL